MLIGHLQFVGSYDMYVKNNVLYKLRPVSLNLKAQLILRINIGHRAWRVDELEEKLNLILRENIPY